MRPKNQETRFAIMQKQFLVSSRHSQSKSVNMAASNLSDCNNKAQVTPIYYLCQNPPYKSPATAGASS